MMGRAHGWLAEIELERGEVDEALALSQRGYDLSTRHGYLFDAALCLRARGKALLASGGPSEGQQCLRDALTRFEAIDAHPEADRTRVTLAPLVIDQ